MGPLWQLYLVYALLALGFGLTGGVSMNAIMTRWFVRRRAQAMSISSTGISVAGVVLPPLGAVLIASGGLALTAPIFSLVIALSVPIVVLVMVWDPSQMGLRPDGHEPPPEDTTEGGALSDLVQRRRWSIREVTRTAPFWAVVIAFTLVLMSQTGFLIHQIAFLEERMGSRTAASLALSTAAFGSIVARLVVGTFADRLNKRRLTAGLFVLQGTAVLLLTFIENDATTYLFTLLFGFTFGNVYMMQSLLVGEIFGLVSFGTVFGLVSFAGQTSSGLGPLLVGPPGRFDGKLHDPVHRDGAGHVRRSADRFASAAGSSTQASARGQALEGDTEVFDELKVGDLVQFTGPELEFGGAAAAANPDVFEVHKGAVDVDGELVGQGEDRDAADEHAGEVAGLVGGGEGDLAGAHQFADALVDVELAGGGDDAGDVVFGLFFRGDDDGVAGGGGGDAVVLAELGGVGEVGVAGHDLVGDAAGVHPGVDLGVDFFKVEWAHGNLRG